MQTNPAPVPQQPVRQPYVPPRLVVHGSIATVTGNLGGTDTDKLGGSAPV
jgi:hypothetical protein